MQSDAAKVKCSLSPRGSAQGPPHRTRVYPHKAEGRALLPKSFTPNSVGWGGTTVSELFVFGGLGVKNCDSVIVTRPMEGPTADTKHKHACDHCHYAKYNLPLSLLLGRAPTSPRRLGKGLLRSLEAETRRQRGAGMKCGNKDLEFSKTSA